MAEPVCNFLVVEPRKNRLPEVLLTDVIDISAGDTPGIVLAIAAAIIDWSFVVIAPLETVVEKFKLNDPLNTE